MENKHIEKINEMERSLFSDPLTFKKAILFCFFTEGVLFAAQFIAYRLKFSFGFVPDILYLASVLLLARIIGKNELDEIFTWRSIPISIFASLLIMFFGFEILMLELHNLFFILLPVTDGFFNNRFFKPDNVILLMIAVGIFPGFTEEIFFRGIIERRFLRTFSPVKAILLSSLIFGIMHLNPWQAVIAFLNGLFTGWLYWRYRSIWLCMFIHAYYNILVTLLPLPYDNVISNFGNIWHFPFWFIILGVILFVLGLLMVIVLSRTEKAASAE